MVYILLPLLAISVVWGWGWRCKAKNRQAALERMNTLLEHRTVSVANIAGFAAGDKIVIDSQKKAIDDETDKSVIQAGSQES